MHCRRSRPVGLLLAASAALGAVRAAFTAGPAAARPAAQPPATELINRSDRMKPVCPMPMHAKRGRLNTRRQPGSARPDELRFRIVLVLVCRARNRAGKGPRKIRDLAIAHTGRDRFGTAGKQRMALVLALGGALILALLTAAPPADAAKGGKARVSISPWEKGVFGLVSGGSKSCREGPAGDRLPDEGEAAAARQGQASVPLARGAERARPSGTRARRARHPLREDASDERCAPNVEQVHLARGVGSRRGQGRAGARLQPVRIEGPPATASSARSRWSARRLDLPRLGHVHHPGRESLGHRRPGALRDQSGTAGPRRAASTGTTGRTTSASRRTPGSNSGARSRRICAARSQARARRLRGQ